MKYFTQRRKKRQKWILSKSTRTKDNVPAIYGKHTIWRYHYISKLVKHSKCHKYQSNNKFTLIFRKNKSLATFLEFYPQKEPICFFEGGIKLLKIIIVHKHHNRKFSVLTIIIVDTVLWVPVVKVLPLWHKTDIKRKLWNLQEKIIFLFFLTYWKENWTYLNYLFRMNLINYAFFVCENYNLNIRQFKKRLSGTKTKKKMMYLHHMHISHIIFRCLPFDRYPWLWQVIPVCDGRYLIFVTLNGLQWRWPANKLSYSSLLFCTPSFTSSNLSNL